MALQALANLHVGVLVETDDTWGRNVVEAACRFAHDAGWSVLIVPRDGQGRLRLPRVWAGQGVIVSLRNSAMIHHLKKLQLPTVDVSSTVKKEDWFAGIATDDEAGLKMALEHLRSRGIENLACYAPAELACPRLFSNTLNSPQDNTGSRGDNTFIPPKVSVLVN